MNQGPRTRLRRVSIVIVCIVTLVLMATSAYGAVVSYRYDERSSGWQWYASWRQLGLDYGNVICTSSYGCDDVQVQIKSATSMFSGTVSSASGYNNVEIHHSPFNGYSQCRITLAAGDLTCKLGY